ncbi:MAG: hypothetical protein U9R75_12145 [Candidatus Thermoplasmatota archaeon]|nr:hypothetical protein [Candidatus Thermoplasmatota archaeon]
MTEPDLENILREITSLDRGCGAGETRRKRESHPKGSMFAEDW